MTFPVLPGSRLADYQSRSAGFTRYPMSASMPEAVSLQTLLSNASDELRDEWHSLTLSYADSRGEESLRTAVAAHYPGLEAEDIQLFSGAQEAIYTLYHVLLSDNDRVQVITPLYEPLKLVAEIIGARVDPVAMQCKASGWQLDVEQWLDKLHPDTAMAVINFPHNPTGAMLSPLQLQIMVDQCRGQGTWLFSDEVFQGLEHPPFQTLPPVASLYEKGISLGVVSKRYGLGGVRVGWIASRDKTLIERLHRYRQLLSICNGRTDELLARMAFEQHERFMRHNRQRLMDNLNWLQSRLTGLGEWLEWSAPSAGCVAFPALKNSTESDHVLWQLLQKEGVMVVPGSCFLQGERHFRVGFSRADFADAWQRFERFMQQQVRA